MFLLLANIIILATIVDAVNIEKKKVLLISVSRKLKELTKDFIMIENVESTIYSIETFIL